MAVIDLSEGAFRVSTSVPCGPGFPRQQSLISFGPHQTQSARHRSEQFISELAGQGGGQPGVLWQVAAVGPGSALVTSEVAQSGPQECVTQAG